MADVAAVAQLSEADLHRLFGARTARAFEEGEVTEDQRRAIYELTKMGPTAFNSQPLRIVWVSQDEARDRLVSHMMPGNQPKTAAAPMTAIVRRGGCSASPRPSWARVCSAAFMDCGLAL